MMNPGVSENSKYSMKHKLNALFSILNVTTRELLSNSVESLQISDKIIFPLRLDQLNFPHKVELPFIKKMISMEKLLHIQKVNLVSKLSSSPSSK
jgi:hypothetical protein